MSGQNTMSDADYFRFHDQILDSMNGRRVPRKSPKKLFQKPKLHREPSSDEGYDNDSYEGYGGGDPDLGIGHGCLGGLI